MTMAAPPADPAVQPGEQRSIPPFQIYLAARVVAAIGAFVVLRLLVDTLSRDDYGSWGYLRIVGALLVPIVSLSLPVALQRFYFDAGSLHSDDTTEKRAELVALVAKMTLISATMLVIAGALGSAAGLLSPATALFIGAGASGMVAVSFADYVARTVDRPWRYFSHRLTELTLLLVGLVVLSGAAAGDGNGVGSTLWWAVVIFGLAQWSVALGSLPLTRQLTSGAQEAPARDNDGSGLAALVRFSLPLTGTFLVGWVLSSSDVAVLRHLSTGGEVADYVLAVAVVAVVTLITQAALVDWPPFFYRLMEREPDEAAHLQSTRRVQAYLAAHACALLGLRLLAPLGYRLLGASDYQRGLDFIAVLGLGNFAYLAGSLLAIGLSHQKRTELTLVIFGLPAVLNVALNWWLVPRYGAEGAAWTTLGSYAILLCLAWILGQRAYRFHEQARIATIVCAATGVALI